MNLNFSILMQPRDDLGAGLVSGTVSIETAKEIAAGDEVAETVTATVMIRRSAADTYEDVLENLKKAALARLQFEVDTLRNSPASALLQAAKPLELKIPT